MNDKGKTPKLRLHKASGRARLRLNGREFYTGPWDFERKRPTPEAQREADRLISLWLSNGRKLPIDPDSGRHVLRGWGRPRRCVRVTPNL